MTENQGNIPLLHRKEWQTMMAAPIITAAGSNVISDPLGLSNISLYMASNTVHYLYHHDEDDWVQIPSGTFAVALAAGVCGTYHQWSTNMTANGGSTSTITVAAASFNINGLVIGKKVRMLTGTAANVGQDRTILSILTNAGTGTITLTLDTVLPAAVVNTDTFKISSGSFFVLNAGTLAATNYFKRFDPALGVWTNLAITGLPATWGTDGAMVTPSLINTIYDSGTAAGTSTTTALDCTGKTWTSGQWVNYQVRITGGTGVGQVSVITANDTDTLTIPAGIDLDATSTFVIEGDDNAIYLMGNNAVTLYKYSISGNTSVTVTPSAARAGAPVVGMTASFVGITGETNWADISDIKNGRYIYCIRGGTAIIDRYDIPTLAWLPTTGVIYTSPITFTTGSSATWNGRYIYIAKEGTAAIPQRFYKYSLRGNYLEPVTSDWMIGTGAAGAALLGNKIWIKNLSSAGTIKWLYCLQSTATNLRRIMLF